MAEATKKAKKRKSLLKESIKSLQGDIYKKGYQVVDIRANLEQLNDQKTDIQISKSSNKVFEQVKNLESQIKQNERDQ